MFAGHITVGREVSNTMMLARHELDPPRSSTTVKFTVFVPFGYGPAGLRERLVMVPSGSNEPLSMADAGTLAWQMPSAFVITF